MKLIYILAVFLLVSCSKDKLSAPCNKSIVLKNFRTGGISRGYLEYDCTLTQQENLDKYHCDSLYIYEGLECTIINY